MIQIRCLDNPICNWKITCFHLKLILSKSFYLLFYHVQTRLQHYIGVKLSRSINVMISHRYFNLLFFSSETNSHCNDMARLMPIPINKINKLSTPAVTSAIRNRVKFIECIHAYVAYVHRSHPGIDPIKLWIFICIFFTPIFFPSVERHGILFEYDISDPAYCFLSNDGFWSVCPFLRFVWLTVHLQWTLPST